MEDLVVRLCEVVLLARVGQRVESPVPVDTAGEAAGEHGFGHAIVGEVRLLRAAEEDEAPAGALAEVREREVVVPHVNPRLIAVAIGLDLRVASSYGPLAVDQPGVPAGRHTLRVVGPEPARDRERGRHRRRSRSDVHRTADAREAEHAALDLHVAGGGEEVGEVDEVQLAVRGVVERHAVERNPRLGLIEAADPEVRVADAVAAVVVSEVAGHGLRKQDRGVLPPVGFLDPLLWQVGEAHGVGSLTGTGGSDLNAVGDGDHGVQANGERLNRWCCEGQANHAVAGMRHSQLERPGSDLEREHASRVRHGGHVSRELFDEGAGQRLVARRVKDFTPQDHRRRDACGGKKHERRQNHRPHHSSFRATGFRGGTGCRL